jgi:ABC-2 type transport system ATP-binding protein
MQQAAIEVRDLSKSFGGRPAVQGVTFTVQPGEIFGFLGPNGAGKTTTIRILTGLLQPSGGSACILGFDVVTQAIEVKRRIGYVADGPYLYEKLNGREFLEFIADLYSVDRREAAEHSRRLLELFELADRAGDLIEGYSHGMRQKLALAAALLHEPRVLFLDEPTSGLDPRSTRTVKDLLEGLAQQGRAILLSTHVLEIAEQMCDRLGIVNRGRLVAAGTLDELRRQARAAGATLEDVFLELTGGVESTAVAAFLRTG